MNNKEVYINGILVDLDESNNPIQLTYAVNDLAELKDRQAYATNTFKLPMTGKNLAACGFPDNPNIIQTQPYRKNIAKIVQAGIEIMPNGIAVISKANKFIEVQILSGLIGLFDKIGDKNIRDLDLSAYDHIWSLANVAGSQLNTDGYIYPVIDYGSLSTDDRRADVRQLRPATFRKTIIEAIIREAGYTSYGSYTAYEKYNSSLVPFSNDAFSHSQAFKDAENTYSASAIAQSDQAFSNDDRDGVVNFTDDYTTDPGGRWNGQEFTAPIVMKVTTTINYTLDVRDQYSGGSTPEIIIMIQRLRGGVWSTIQQVVHPAGADFVTQRYENQVLEADIDLNSGDKIRIAWHSEPATNRVLGVWITGSKVIIEYQSGDVIYGQAVQLAATLPDISQKNFFKDFLQNFGLIVIPDNYRQTVLMINMEDVYANKPIATDITDKLINSPDDISYSLTGYGINNYANYKEDDNVSDGLGDGVMILDNLTLTESIDLFESVFSASEKVIKMGGLNVTQILKIEKPSESLELKKKTEPRILLNRTLNSTFEFYDGLASQSVSVISLPTFDGLDYQTLFEENYPEIKRMLYRPFVVVKQILLSEVDIANIDWTIPVYDKKSASYYYKNQITYIQGDVSTISLIRLP